MEESQEKPRVNYGRRNKVKGNNAERLYAKLFREVGFSKCITAREGSRLYDDCAVDLIFLPILVQIKAGKQKAMNTSKVLMDMRDRIADRFPEDAPEQTMPKVIIHHKDREVKGSQVRTEYDQLVTMTVDTFLIFLKAYKNDLQNSKGKNP